MPLLVVLLLVAVQRLSSVEPSAAGQTVVLPAAVVLRVHVAAESVLCLEPDGAHLALVAHQLVVGAEVQVVRLLRRERLAARDAPVVAPGGVRRERARVGVDLVADEAARLAARRGDDLTVPARQVHLEPELRVEGERAEEARVLEDRACFGVACSASAVVADAGGFVRRRLPHGRHVARLSSPQRGGLGGGASRMGSGCRIDVCIVRLRCRLALRDARLLFNVGH